ncbi:hypothetical protein D3C78_542950 [compost metagenome]
MRAQGQERRHGRRRSRRRYRDVLSASFRQAFFLNRGHPTQEGEQAGVAFLLVTFLWPRKEKSLAQARRAGETPSRTKSSCPAWRGHAIHTWDDIAPSNEVTQPLTLTLSRKGRGDQTEVSEAGGRNPVEGSALVSCMAEPCHSGVGRHCTKQ